MAERIVTVTGASGFVGTALCAALERGGWSVRRAGRGAKDAVQGDFFPINDLAQGASWEQALNGVDFVVHLASRTHVLRDSSVDALADYRKVNVAGTAALARQAAASGVKRLVFLSSIKVNGESTSVVPFTERDDPRPEDGYGISKWEAEQALLDLAGKSGLQTVILRPPLVYGPGVKGNFLRLLGAVQRGLPMPFAAVRNQRSLIYVGNLVDAIIACLEAPAAAGKTYLVSDGADVSTPDLVRKLAQAMSRPARLLPCPPALLKYAAGLLGKRDAALRLTGSLRIDSSRIREELGWRPRVGLNEGLALTAQWYDRGRQ